MKGRPPAKQNQEDRSRLLIWVLDQEKPVTILEMEAATGMSTRRITRFLEFLKREGLLASCLRGDA